MCLTSFYNSSKAIYGVAVAGTWTLFKQGQLRGNVVIFVLPLNIILMFSVGEWVLKTFVWHLALG